MKIIFILILLFPFKYCSSQEFFSPYFIDSLISSESYDGRAVMGSYEGEINGNESPGLARVIYYMDSTSRKLFKVIKIDSLGNNLSYLFLNYYKNQLVKSESIEKVKNEIVSFNVCYYLNNRLLYCLTPQVRSFLPLSKEYINVLIK